VLFRRTVLICCVVAVLVAAAWPKEASQRAVPAAASSAAPTAVTTTTTMAARPATTSAPAPSAPAARAPRPAPGPPPPPPPGLGVGARGPEVLALEQRLDTLHYDTGAVDGLFDSNTAFAVTALQKVYGMPRSGRATDDVLAAVPTATDPPPVVPGGGARRVEIDVPRQVLFLYQNDTLFKILPVSTGSGARYCVDGGCARAVTPGGSYRVFQRVSGWQKSRLGMPVNLLYFNGGIAIHGAPSVPPYPASHGSVRIPLGASHWFPALVPNGTPVYVKGVGNAPVPFNEPAPNGAPPNQPPPPPSTTTTEPPTTSTTTKGVL